MNFKMSALLLLVLVSSCNRQEYDPNFYEEFSIPETSGEEVFDGDPEPKRPPIEEAMEGIFGVDSDNDGVRDDVEIWINRHFDDPLKRKAYKEYYRHHALMLAYTQNKERDELEAFVDESGVFYRACLARLYTKAEIHKKDRDLDLFFKVKVNTHERQNIYSKLVLFNRKTYGSIVRKEELEYIKKCPFNKGERSEHFNKLKELYEL